MKRTTQTVFTLLRIGIAVGLLTFLGFSGAIDWSALAGLALAWPITLAALLVLLVDLVVTAWRLSVLLRPQGLHLPLASSVRLTLIGNFFNMCLPGSTGGDGARIYYAMRGNQGRRTEVATILLLDRAVGMFALLVFPLLVAPLFPQLVASSTVFSVLLKAAAIGAAIMVAAFVAATSSVVMRSRLVAWLFRMLPLGQYLEKVAETVGEYRRHVGTLVAAVAISLLAHSMSISVVLLLAEAVAPDGAAWPMAALIPLGFLANTVPLTPGGLGVGEAAFNKLFTMADLAGGAEMLLGWRLLMVLTGLVGLAFYLQGHGHFVRSLPTGAEAAGQPVDRRATMDDGFAAPAAADEEQEVAR